METFLNSSSLIVPSWHETAHNNIMAHALLKIQLYAKRLYNEVSLSLSLSLSHTHTHTHTHVHVHTRSIPYYNLFSRVLMDVELSMFFMMQLSSVAARVSSFCFPGCIVQRGLCSRIQQLLWQFSCLHIALVVSYWVSCCALLLHSNHLMMTLVDSKLSVLTISRMTMPIPASCYGSLHKRSIQSDHLFLGYDP